MHICLCICAYLFSFCWKPEEGFRSTRAGIIGCCQKPDGNPSLGTPQEQKALNCWTISLDTISHVKIPLLYKNKWKCCKYKNKYSTWSESFFYFYFSTENIMRQSSWPSLWLLSYCRGNNWLCNYNDLAPSQTNFMRQDTFVDSHSRKLLQNDTVWLWTKYLFSSWEIALLRE